MSEVEFQTGKLKEVKPVGELSIEGLAARILKSHNHKISKWHDSALDSLRDEFQEQYIVIGGKIYEVFMEQKDPYDDIYEASHNQDGSISFTVKYYNGGCGFDEAIEKALESIKPVDPPKQ